MNQIYKNILVGCIYWLLCMDPKEFILFLKSLTNKLSKGSNKEIILLGDFNTDLIKTNTNNNASEFCYIIYSSYLIPHITSVTRSTSRSHTLIDNILSNIITEDAISLILYYKYNILSFKSILSSNILLFHVKHKMRNSPKKL